MYQYYHYRTLNEQNILFNLSKEANKSNIGEHVNLKTKN